MERIDRGITSLRDMDELAAMESPVHALHPLAKLIMTIAYVLLTVSFGKYDVSGLLVMAAYPAVLFSLSGVSVKTCLYKLRFVLPLVCAVGLFNPLFDRTPMWALGTLTCTGGMLSMVTLLIKGVLCLMASFLLASTTPIDALCAALRSLHLPRLLVILMLLTYRYIAVLAEEVSVMVMAYRLRAPGQRGIHISAWGSFLGQLLLRSMDRAENLYAGMLLRGFSGDFSYATVRTLRCADVLCSVLVVAVLVLFRSVNIIWLLGSLVTGGRV